jgi:hypothetical protein
MQILAAIFLAITTVPAHAADSALPTDLEFALALSALPPHLRDQATVYRYEPVSGYVVAREGSNGFHAIVGRDDPGIRFAPWTLDEYPEDILIPVGFDQAGVETHLLTYLDLGAMRATGVPAAEAQRRLREGFASGRYRAPGRAGIAYMLSPVLRAYRSAEQSAEIGTFMTPHYMFYAPDTSPRDIGAGRTLQHPFMLHETADVHGLVIQLAGEKERAAIFEAHSELVARLCSLRAHWCVSQAGT